MAYKIQYDRTGYSKRRFLYGKWLVRIGWGLLGLCILAGILWCANGNWSVTVGAMEGMAESLVEGTNISDAFAEFCLEVLEGA